MINPGLERMRALLARLDHPEQRLPPVIHVAGTNGKGSTVAFLRAFFEVAGRRTHVFTSPHLISVRECVRLADAPGRSALIADAHLADCFARVKAASDDACRPTPFEALTLAALLAFAETPADALLLETGMGGREDATNVVDRPAAAVVTTVSRDHMEFLGSGLAGIAGHKAGVLKTGAPAVVAPQSDAAALAVIEAAAAKLHAPLSLGGRDWLAYADGGGMTYVSRRGARSLPRPALAGAHQIVNAATAIAALEAAFPALATDDVLARGLLRVCWPGRLQPVAFDGDMQVWADGGHNDSGGAALAAWAAETPPFALVVGMLANKDAAAFLAPLAPFADRLVAVPIGGAPRPARPAADIAAVAYELGIPGVGTAPDVAAALALLAADGCRRTLVCGSLHLLPEVLPPGVFDMEA